VFAKPPGAIFPRTRKGIDVKKTAATIFFTHKKLLVASDFLKGQKYNQDNFISDILPDLE
jgi:hypothetical protein